MELKCVCKCLLKHLMVHRFLREGGREFQIEHASPIVCSFCSFIKDMCRSRCLHLQVDMYAVCTDVRTYVCKSLSVHSFVCEILYVCVCSYVYAIACLYAD